MWEILGWVAWIISAAIFLWMAWDFFEVNAKLRRRRSSELARGRRRALPAGDQSSTKEK